jgi:hypothetical protein
MLACTRGALRKPCVKESSDELARLAGVCGMAGYRYQRFSRGLGISYSAETVS